MVILLTHLALLARAAHTQRNARAPGTWANQESIAQMYMALAHRTGFHSLAPIAHMMCAFMEYLSQHIQAPTTIKNKTSHVRTFLHMTGKRMEGADHTLIARALDSLLQNKNYVPIIKDAISMEAMCRALYCFPETNKGGGVKAAILLCT